MAADGYASGLDADWDAETDVDNDLNEAVAAAHDGASGYEVTYDDANAAYGTLNLDAVDQTSGVISFWFSRKDAALESGKTMNLALTRDGADAIWHYLAFVHWPLDNYYIQAARFADGAVWAAYDATYVIPDDGYHHYILKWKRSTGAGNDDGYGHFYVDGVLVGSSTSIDDDTRDWDLLQIGMVSVNQEADFGGSFYFDEVYIDPTEVYWRYAMAGAITPAGAVIKGIGKPSLAGTVTPAGTIERLVAWYRSLAGTVTPAGTVIKGITKLTFTGLITPVGSIVKGIGKALAGTITPAGRLIQRIANFFRIWFDGSPETVARIDITTTADVQLDDSPETTVILEQ